MPLPASGRFFMPLKASTRPMPVSRLVTTRVPDAARRQHQHGDRVADPHPPARPPAPLGRPSRGPRLPRAGAGAGAGRRGGERRGGVGTWGDTSAVTGGRRAEGDA